MTPSSPAWNDIGCPVAGKSACVLGGAASVSVNMGLERWVGEYVREEIDAGHWVVLSEPGRLTNHRRLVALHERRTPGAE